MPDEPNDIPREEAHRQVAGRMDKRQRVEFCLNGIWQDRPPFTFWYHFPADKVAGEACARAHLEHFEKYDVDILKVMNDNGYPAPQGTLRTPQDLESLVPQPVDRPEFQNQLEALRIIDDELSDREMFITTFFNPLNVLDKMTDGRAMELIKEDAEAADYALSTIAQSLAEFADACIHAGAAGIFMSCSDSEVAKVLGPDAYRRHVMPHDLAVFEAVPEEPLNTVHVHKKAADFDMFLEDYPVPVINWADRTDGPDIASVFHRTNKTLMCGMDHVGTIVEGTPTDVRDEIYDAVEQADGQPIIVAPGCSFPSDAPAENLHAVTEAMTEWREQPH